MSKFELIPNEILWEIFEYLSSYDIFHGFYYLNSRYERFLRTLQLRIDLINISKTKFDFYSYFLFEKFGENFLAFRCEDCFNRLVYQIHIEHFRRLKYLTIENLTIEHLQMIIPKLNYLINLIYLNLQIENKQNEQQTIVFQGKFPLLQKCILNIHQKIEFYGEDAFPNLKDLTIDQCAIDDLILFLHIHTTQLECLTVTLIDQSKANVIETNFPLKSLNMNANAIPFRHFIRSICPFFPSLEQLSITARDIDYTNGKQWENVLSANFPHLKTFEILVTFSQDNLPNTINHQQILQLFQTSYYYSHRWTFAIYQCPSTSTINFFSIPILTKKLNFNLYQTDQQQSSLYFDHIRELDLYLTDESNKSTQFFPNIEHLKLISHYREYQTFPKSLLVDISHLLNLSKLKSIEFFRGHFPSVSLVLLEYTPNLQSLSIPLKNLIKMTKELTDEKICQTLTKLIQHLTITSIENLKSILFFERFPLIFSSLQSLSLSLQNSNDLYMLIVLILSKMLGKLQTLTISIENSCEKNFLEQFMSWLMDYLRNRDLFFVDIQLIDFSKILFALK